jgi:hypothetical protein
VGGERRKKKEEEEECVSHVTVLRTCSLSWVLFSRFIFGYMLDVFLYCYGNIYGFVVGMIRDPRSK